jgi:hypothetical protein
MLALMTKYVEEVALELSFNLCVQERNELGDSKMAATGRKEIACLL